MTPPTAMTPASADQMDQPSQQQQQMKPQSQEVSDEQEQHARVVVLSVNDVYDMYPDQHGVGGIAQLATLLARERASVPTDATLLVTLNGDFLSGSQIATRHRGAHMVELLNHLAVDYVVLGNHEFDFGEHVLRERMASSQFQWLGSNVMERATSGRLPGIVDSKLIPLTDGLQLGVFGVCTQETPDLSFPGDNIYFDDVSDTSARCVRELRGRGAHFIVALTHLSIAQDRQLARKVPGIDVILGGHDHEPFTVYEGKTLIHKSGQNATWLARMEFELHQSSAHPERPLQIVPQWSMIANYGIPPEPACQQIVAKYMQALLDEANSAESKRVLATLALPLSTKTSQLRTRECNMGNLVADAMRSELRADCAMINGGFIRGDTVYDARTNLTVGILNQEMPFMQATVLLRIKACDFADGILQQLGCYPQPASSFPHVSGVRVVIDHQSKDSKPRITSLKNEAGNEIDRESVVLVAMTTFNANGGEGCTAWRRGEIVETCDRISVILAEFLLKKRLIAYPEREGRMTIHD